MEVLFVYAEYVKYDEYIVYKIVPKTKDEVDILKGLQDNHEYSFWTDAYKEGDDVRIMVGPGDHSRFENFMKDSKIDFNIIVGNIQRHIDRQLKRPTRNVNNVIRNFEDYEWDYYMGLEEIYGWLNKTAEDYPDVVTLVNIGTSLEGRALMGVIIDFKKSINSTRGFIEGGIHAREWISTDPNVRTMAEDVLWHIFPVLNPDGYAYTFTHFEIGIKGMDKLTARHGTEYLTGTSLDILYWTSESSDDWAKGTAGIPIVFLFELPDLGEYGFLLPPEHIIPNNEEVMDGLAEMNRVSKSLGYY